MKILAIAPAYPYPAFPFSGIFNERCIAALRRSDDEVEVLVPRPYVPPFLGLHPRWRAYEGIPAEELRNGIMVRRPAVVRIPRVGGPFWSERIAYYRCRGEARRLHGMRNFDVVISFDLLNAGGLAWRLARDLGIPSCGWAFGGDVRAAAGSASARSVARTIGNLDLVFYQSKELLGLAASLCGDEACSMTPPRHVVLAHGIPLSSDSPGHDKRAAWREAWGVDDDSVVVLSIGRIIREKGVFELLDALSIAAGRDSRIVGVLIGSVPGFDETAEVRRRLDRDRRLRRHVRIFSACAPDRVREALHAADIFAFASRHEGMPNSLLEAMAEGLPAVAFAIPPVEELDGGAGVLAPVPPFDAAGFAEALQELAASAACRADLGAKGRRRVCEDFSVEKNMAAARMRIESVVEQWKR